MIDPVIKEITVPAPPARAFELFTAQIGKWWPLDTHSLSAAAGQRARDVRMEPRIGGAIIETLQDGSAANWGIITTWIPDRKLAFTWHLRRPEAEQTLVTVEFTAVSQGTQVRLTHSGWEAQDKDAAANREQYDRGWNAVLARYAESVGT